MINEKNLNVLFVKRAKKDGLSVSVSCRISYGGRRCNDFASGVQCLNAEWDSKAQRCKGRGAKDKNLMLEGLKSDITEAYFRLKALGRPFVAQAIKDLAIKEDAPAYLAEVAAKFLEHKKAKVTPGSFRSYKGRVANLLVFAGGMPGAASLVSDVGTAFAAKFDEWLRARGYMRSHCSKHISLLKSLVAWAEMMELSPSRLRYYPTGQPKPKPKNPLSPDQVAALMRFGFVSARLRQVADLFVFQCFTGLSYVDTASFDRRTDVVMFRGEEWIEKARGKTGVTAALPLLPEAAAILAKYPDGLPKISNEKYNAYIKEAFAVVGIERHVSTRTARTTFAQTMYEAGASTEAVAKMLGHTNTKTTAAYYVGLTKELVANALEKGKK